MSRYAAPRQLTVLRAGPLTTVQDDGRPGRGALGISRSGACDRASHRLANALVGNDQGAATLEVTLGGLVVRAGSELVVAITGARCPGTPHNAPLHLQAGEELALGVPPSGLRSYLAVRGGVTVEPVLGSRSTDILSGLGPDPLQAGDILPVGTACGPMPGVDLAPVPDAPSGLLSVRVTEGPRRDWFSADAWHRLLRERYTVTPQSNRIGVRLEGAALPRARTGELPSEGMARGAVQVPPSGQPVLFLADHPVTGGYPVIAYVTDAEVDDCAQLRPGQQVTFRDAPGSTRHPYR